MKYTLHHERAFLQLFRSPRQHLSLHGVFQFAGGQFDQQRLPNSCQLFRIRKV